MTIEELKELKKTVRAGFYVDDTDGDEEFFKVINQSDEIKILELIDEKISQLSVTDEDVERAIHSIKEHIQLHRLRNYPQLNIGHSLDLAIQALQQMQKEPCEYCKDGVYYDVLGTPCKYNNCPMCGRKLR